MPIPALTQFGVLPAGRHDCTLDEIEATYTHNLHRQALWGDFGRFLEWARNYPMPANILVDGGFTSDKAAPKDIDIVFDLSGCQDATRNHWYFVYATQRDILFDRFRVDFWVFYPEANRDLRAFFEYVKPEEAIVRGMQPGDLKGLLRVVP